MIKPSKNHKTSAFQPQSRWLKSDRTKLTLFPKRKVVASLHVNLMRHDNVMQQKRLVAHDCESTLAAHQVACAFEQEIFHWNVSPTKRRRHNCNCFDLCVSIRRRGAWLCWQRYVFGARTARRSRSIGSETWHWVLRSEAQLATTW